MSLLMQALRKAERARSHNAAEHPEEQQFGQDSVSSPPPIEGGPAFAVMPDSWRLEPLDAEPPVVAAQEAAHDPVPPQARHEPPGPSTTRTSGVPSADPVAERTRAVDDLTGSSAGPGRSRLPEAATRSEGVRSPGARPPAPPRAIASSQRRLIMLAGTLAALLAVFAFIYWRAVFGPGPGARLPMVPMPAPGALPAAQTGVQQAAIPVTPYVITPGSETPPPGAAGTATGAPATAAPATPAAGTPALAAMDTPTASLPPPATPASPASPAARTGAAPASKPRADVTVPTPEQLAAITDPAIRAEAMRDASERAARQVRMEGASPAPSTVAGAEPGPNAAPPAAAAAAPATAEGKAPAGRPSIRRSRSRRPTTASAVPPAAPEPATRTAAVTAALPTAVGDHGDVRFMRSAESLQVAPAVQHGFQALQAGDLATARQQYDLALLQDPNSRDALLGSAAVALREHDGKQASANYLRLLELDPNDPEALAGLAELHPGDLQASEIRLRGLARQHPDSGPVQFALGNLYARQGRWPEAQQSYFRAVTAMPGNADYAFNLGVGLDRMNQPRLAATYYRRALELAQASPPGFNIDAVRKRLQALETTAQ